MNDTNNADASGCPGCGWSPAACRCAEHVAESEATDALVDELASCSVVDELIAAACECCLASPCVFIQARNRSAA
jgi:hypothetical protein